MNNTQTKSTNTRMLTEAGLCIAMAIVLSYLKIPIGAEFGGFGGSIDFVMVPLVFFALKWGAKWGCIAGLVFGTLKYFLAAGFAVNIVSIFFDYSIAYAAVGLAGLFANKDGAPGIGTSAVAAIVGCVARFVIHFISGVTVYAEYMPENFANPAIYSLFYNGTYMLPNTIICVLVITLLAKPLSRLYLSK